MVTFFTILLIFQKTVASQCTVGDTVVFTGPPKTEQKLWPGHCVQESWGSNFHKDLIVSLISFLPPQLYLKLYLSLIICGLDTDPSTR